MNLLNGILLVVITLFGADAKAAEPPTVLQTISIAQAKLDFIRQLEKDGYLSTKMADEVKQKYVNPEELAMPGPVSRAQAEAAAKPKESIWDRYVSWSNFLKVVAVVLLLIAFGGTISNIIAGLWHILIAVPPIAYQLPLLGATVTGTLAPQLLWASQGHYIALFCSFANIILLGWVLLTHDRLAQALARLFNFGIPIASVVSFWAMLYFGALALHYQSSLFGFFAAVALSGVLSFGLYYSRGTLFLHFHEKGTAAVVFGHLLLLATYVVLNVKGTLPPEAEYFRVGVEYYCTVALCVGLLVGSAPFTRKDSVPGYVLLFCLVFAAATAGYFFLDMKVIASIVTCFFILFVLEWLSYLGYKAGVIFGSAVLGASLYATSLVLEKYGHYVVLSVV
jgi:hypothetical protein